MKNFLLIVNGKAINDYMNLKCAVKKYKEMEKNNLVSLVDLRSGWTLLTNYE